MALTFAAFLLPFLGALAAPVLTVPGGEAIKNGLEPLHRIQQAIQDARLCRHSYVVAIGGGAVLDVAGYAAALAHRGVRLIRVPTTVLAQDDSGVGVKNGINAYGHQKNYLGTFAPPAAVINDSSFLTSLSDRDWRGGISEAIKVALIKDARFFDFIERNAAKLTARHLPTMEKVVRRSAELHLTHIATSGDPFELGSARPLERKSTRFKPAHLGSVAREPIRRDAPRTAARRRGISSRDARARSRAGGATRVRRDASRPARASRRR